MTSLTFFGGAGEFGGSKVAFNATLFRSIFKLIVTL